MNFADELNRAASVEPAGVNGNKVPRRHEPVAAVMSLADGFDLLLAMCRAKKIFDRPFWAEMHPPEGGDEAQLRWYVARKCPEPDRAAIWMPGSYCRLFYRTHPRQVWSQLSVGTGMTLENRVVTYRALWDVGIREIHNHLWADNPHTETVVRMGEFEISHAQRPGYLHGVKYLVERP